MMKATLSINGKPVKKVQVSFYINAADLETAIIHIWVLGEGATKKRVEKEIQTMLYSGGNDVKQDWVDDMHREQYQIMATEHAKKLFPTFYKLDKL